MDQDLHVISFALCPYVQRVVALLHEKNVAFRTTYIDLKNKPAWFLEISPRGRVPVLVVDGVTLFESANILEYLDETHGERLAGKTPLDRARQRGWVEVANDLFMANYKLDTAQDEAATKAALTELDVLLGRFESQVQGSFFNGEEIALVDFAAAPSLVRLLLLEREAGVRLLAKYPKVEAWARALESRPSIQKRAPADFVELQRAAWRERGTWLLRSAA